MLNSPFLKAVRSLSFQHDQRAELSGIELRGIKPGEWPALLKLTDHSQITLPLGIRCRDYLPESVRDRIDRNLADNAQRHDRLFAEYRLIADALQERSIDFVVLKGLSHVAPFYVNEFCHRPQYDIDLYTPPALLAAARDAMIGAGFAPIRPQRKRTDHLPSMMRNTHWKWRGDYYAPDLPLTVELHFRFWDPQTERLPASCVESFWRRRTTCAIRGIEIPVLSLPDRVSYSALHLVRHLLRGDLRTYHVYELAHFLHHTEKHHELWEDWQDGRATTSCVIEAVAFRLAVEWFGCRLHPIASETVTRLPSKIARWFELFAFSPLALGEPNKDELFLHLSLLENTIDRYAIVARRLFPRHVPKLVEPTPPDGERSLVVHLGAALRQTIFIARRTIHHLRTTVPLIRSFFRWKAASRKYAVS